jgi:hypothetical protein
MTAVAPDAQGNFRVLVERPVTPQQMRDMAFSAAQAGELPESDVDLSDAEDCARALAEAGFIRLANSLEA